MPNAFPFLIAGGAALLLLGGKKKKTTAAPEEKPEPIDEIPDEEMDEGEGPQPEEIEGESPGYGSVAHGVRKDKRGHHPWRVYYDAEGYHAQIMRDASRFSPVVDEAGIAASSKAAKGLLRDYFNELLIEKYPNEQPKNDPADITRVTVTGFKTT